MIRGMATVGGEAVHGAHDSEVVAALLALNAIFEVALPTGPLESPALRFLRDPAEDLGQGGLLQSLMIPGVPEGAALERVAVLPSAPALMAVAVTISFAGEKCARARIALTGLRVRPARIPEAEARVGGSTGDAAALQKCLDQIAARAQFRDDAHAPASYRRDVALVLARRALERAIAQARGGPKAAPPRPRPSLPLRLSTELPYFTSGMVEMWLNGERRKARVEARTTLLDMLRGEGLRGVKHGCETGECGACTVLLDGRPGLLVPHAGLERGRAAGGDDRRDGHAGRPAPRAAGVRRHGCDTVRLLHAGHGAVRQGAARRRPTADGGGRARRAGRVPVPLHGICQAGRSRPARGGRPSAPGYERADARSQDGRPVRAARRQRQARHRPRHVRGRHRPARACCTRASCIPRTLMRASRRIDACQARAMPGVACVLTHEDVPRVPYTTAGQGWPEPSPYDAVMLDRKVRFVGDRVAVVAADDPELARRACEAIKVEYEVLPAVFDPEQAMDAGAPVIHDQADASGIKDAARNLAARIRAEVGARRARLREAERVFEATYRVPYVQQSSIEPHITITWLDEDNRLIVRTSTQVPFHVRRIIAPLLEIPVRRIRVIKPRMGGGFGGKQEVLIEDLCGMLTLRTGRPVRLEFTREEELTAARTRHPQILTVKSGVAGRPLTALQMEVLENTGAYGTHALTVMSVTGNRALSLYRCPNLRYEARAVYTNLAVAGAFRGYGCPQGFFALESHVDEVAAGLGEDPLEFRRRNHVQEGDEQPIAEVLGEGKEGYRQVIRSCGLPQAIELGRGPSAGPRSGRRRRSPGPSSAAWAWRS